MAKQIIKWEAEDGEIYDTEEQALKADLEVYKTKAAAWDEHQKQQKKAAAWDEHQKQQKIEEAKRNRSRMPYHERGSHQ